MTTTRWRRRSRVVLTLALVLVAVAFLAGPSLAQQAAALGKDARNKPYYEDGFCYGHHYPRISPDWVNPDITAEAPAEVVVGVPFTVNLSVNNNWKYYTNPSPAMLNLTGAPNLRVLLEEASAETTATGSVLRVSTLPPYAGKTTVALAIPANPSSLVVTLTPLTPTAGTPAGPDLDLALIAPDGRVVYSNTTGAAPEVLDVPQDLAVFHGGQEWKALVTYKGGAEPTVDFQLVATAVTDPAALRHVGGITDELREPRERHVFTWTLVADAPGPAHLDFRARIFNFHKHTPADEGHTSDDGNITRYDTADVLVLGAPREPVQVASKSFIPAAGALLVVGAVAAAALAGARRR